MKKKRRFFSCLKGETRNAQFRENANKNLQISKTKTWTSDSDLIRRRF